MQLALRTPFALTIVAILGCVAAAQQNPHGQLPVTSFPEPFLLLIRDPIVHDDLGLDVEERQVLGELNDELDVQLWSMRNKSAQHIAETMRTATETAENRLASLLTRRQQQRLEQIELWALGMKAFTGDAFAKRLGLSQNQREDIREIMKETQEAIDELSRQLQSGGSKEAVEREARERRSDEQKRILASLSRQQQQQWVWLLGERIDVSKLGRVKFKAPELKGEAPWINSPPQTLERLRGNVVALHFYAFGCINCKRNFPWYKGWHRAFADQGFVVLGVHTPEVERERDIENVRREAENAGLTFPILIDNEKRNWNAWGNSMWPSVYLIDKQGYVRAWWYGELNWQGANGESLLQKRIEELLAEKGP